MKARHDDAVDDLEKVDDVPEKGDDIPAKAKNAPAQAETDAEKATADSAKVGSDGAAADSDQATSTSTKVKDATAKVKDAPAKAETDAETTGSEATDSDAAEGDSGEAKGSSGKSKGALAKKKGASAKAKDVPAKAERGGERSGRGSSVATWVLGALVVGLAAAVVWVGLIVLDKKEAAEDRAKALQSARQMGVNLMTVDHATAQKDLDRILAGATGDLKNQLATQSKVFIDSVAKAQTKSTVSQVDAAVVSIDGDSAEVMVSLNGMVTNPKVPNGVTRPYRYQMDLTKSGDRWLVSKLEMVP